jgi:photosystem II stability/assembly factor-like uncharacterized protein
LGDDPTLGWTQELRGESGGHFLKHDAAARIDPSVGVLLALLFVAPSLCAQWKALGPFGGSMQTVQLDPHRRGTAIAGAANGLIFRSRDFGDSWSALPFPAELRGTLHALLIDPVHADAYFAAVSSEIPEYSGLFRSRDSGATWTRVPGLRDQRVWSLAASPANPHILAAGTEDGLYLTVDSGENWQRISPDANPQMQPVVSIAFHPRNSAVLYMGTPHLAWKTIDGGAQWQLVHAGVSDDSDIFSILVDRTAPNRVFIAACSGVYRSLNGGATWSRSASAVRAGSYRTYFVAQSPDRRHALYAGTADGLIRSLDGGATWTRLSTHAARAIAWDAAHPRRMLIASAPSAVLRSEDEGLHFSEVNRGLSSLHLAPLAEAAGMIWTSVLGGASAQGVLKLPVDAAAWQIVPQQTGLREIRRIVPVADSPGEAYAIASGTLFHSTDGGQTWANVPAPAALTIVLPASGVLLAASDAGLFRSEDRGLHWYPALLPSGFRTVDELTLVCPSVIAAVMNRRVLLSSDGVSWRTAAEIPGTPEILGLAGSGCGGLLAATAAGLLRSDDLGESWRDAADDLRGRAVQAVAVSALSGLQFAAASGLVYLSRDGGNNWQPLTRDSPSDRIQQILLVSAGAPRLLVLTEGRGVYELQDLLSVSAQRGAPPK